MKKLKVGARLMILVAVLSAFAAIVGVVGLRGLADSKERLGAVYENRTVALVELGDVLYNTLSIRRQLDLADLADTPAALAAALDQVPRLDAERDRAWGRYRSRSMDAEEQGLADRADRDKHALMLARNQVLESLRTGGTRAAVSATDQVRLDERFAAFHADMVNLINLQARLARSEYEGAQQEYLRFRFFGLVSLLSGLLIGIVAAASLIRSVAKPLGAAIRAADAVAAGDLSVELPPAGKDQFGQLLRSLARMQVNLRAMSEEIRARVAQLEDMSNALPLGIFQLRADPDGRYAYNFVAHRIETILGVSAEEIMRDPAARWRHAHPDDYGQAQGSLAALVRRARAGEAGATSEIITRVVIDGETRLVLSTAHAAAPLADGTVTLSGYYQDVSAQRREQQLLQGVLDECPSVVFIKDLDGKHLLTNRAFDRILGLAPGSAGALGKTDADLFPPAVAQRIRVIDTQVLSTGEVLEFEEEIPLPAGRRDFRTIKFPLLDESGKPYVLCGISNDITERRAIELALRDSEAYNKVLFQESHVPIVVLDPDSRRFVDCNRAAAIIFGYDSQADVIGKTPLDVSAPQQYDGTDSRSAFKRRTDDALRQRSASQFEWRHRRPNGEIWDGLVNQTTFSHGATLLIMVTLEDITLRRRAEQAIRAAKDAAEEAARVKSDFLAIMSHEIRTPLNAILGNLELLARAGPADSERERLRTIMTAARSLLDIINDILDFSKADASQLRLEVLPFDLVATVEEVLAMFAPNARAKGLQLHYSVAPAMPRRYAGDATRIRQVVTNLVSNAIKFTDAGSVSVDLRNEAGPDAPSRVVVSVTDTGIGIDAPHQQHLFKPFTQADSSITRRFGGTGLGLALCKRLVELMDGTIGVESVAGLGSRFTVSLPLPAVDAADAADVAAASPPAPAAPPLPSTQPLRVLVAEDHPFNRRLLQDQLQALGHEADFAETGQQALMQFAHGQYDIVLTDLSMPELDGYGLAQGLRAQGNLVPIIAITAHTTDEAHRRCLEAGIDKVLSKPFSLAELDTAIRTLVRAAAPAMPDPGTVGAAAPRPLPPAFHATLKAACNASLAAIGAALAGGDSTRASAELHSMKGALSMAGMTSAARACADLQALLKQDGELRQEAVTAGLGTLERLAAQAFDQAP